MSATPDAGRRGLAALCVTGVLWGTIGIVVRLLQDRGFATIGIAFWRLVCATVVALACGGLASLRGQVRRPGRLLAVSAGSLVFQVLYFFAVHDVGVAVATLVTLGLAPVALAALELARSRTPPSIVLISALAGLALVTLAGSGSSGGAHPARGLVEATASGLFYAASTAWSANLTTRVGPIAITLATSALGVVALLPVMVFTGFPLPSTPSLTAGVVWLGVVTTVLAYGLFYFGLRSTPGSIAMIVTLLEPVTAVALAALLVDEPLTPANVVGGVLLLGSVAALYARARRPRPTPPPPP